MSSGYHIVDQFAAYFMTLTVVGWVDLFTRVECKKIIIDSLRYCQNNKGLLIYAYVLMESHVHLIAAADDGSIGLSGIVRDFKKFTSREIIDWLQKNSGESRREWLKMIFEFHAKFNPNNKHYQVWQQHNMPKMCIHPKFIRQKIDYIHFNPVKSEIVDKPEDYKYSSARNYAGRDDYLLKVKVLDFGSEVGYVP